MIMRNIPIYTEKVCDLKVCYANKIDIQFCIFEENSNTIISLIKYNGVHVIQ